MKQTSKAFYNALETVYREIKYDNPENTGYPFDTFSKMKTHYHNVLLYATSNLIVSF